MSVLRADSEEPPSRPQATSKLLIKPNSLIHTPLAAGAPRLDAVVVRMERFPVGPQTRAFRKRFYPEVESLEWNDWRWQAGKPHPHARRA